MSNNTAGQSSTEKTGPRCLGQSAAALRLPTARPYRRAFFRPPFRPDFLPPFFADFFRAPFFAAIRSAPVLEWSARPIPRWIGGRGSARRGTKPERAEPAVRGRIEARAVGARHLVAHEGLESDSYQHHLSTTGGAALLLRARRRTIAACTSPLRLVTPGAPTPGRRAGAKHQGASVERSVMQDQVGR
jgi:hypothetical protein